MRKATEKFVKGVIQETPNLQRLKMEFFLLGVTVFICYLILRIAMSLGV